ncbi:hypothetical protein AOG1_12340 [Geobacter sp. AOG1]|nr:hypothetical protein AOG1_12340 [Geobacter sp. AOG1]
MKNMIGFFVVHEFHMLKDFCNFIESLIDQEVKRLNEEYELKLKNVDDGVKYSMGEYYGSMMYQIGEEFSDIHWNSIYCTAYNLFEVKLSDICKHLQVYTKNKITLKDIAGSGIEQCKIYLSKVYEISTPFATDEWKHISNFCKIRNVIVHTGGFLDLDNKNHKVVYDYCKASYRGETELSETTINNKTTGTMKLKAPLVYRALDNYGKFFDELLKTLSAYGY